MNYIITVDGGTSNTRTYLWTANGQILTQRSQAIGAKTSAINGSSQAWKKAIHNMIESMLTECAVSDNAIQGVYMSGMLTSDLVSPIIGIRTQVSGFAFKISSGIPALSFPNMMKQSGS